MRLEFYEFLRKKLIAFRRDERGFALILFALAVVPMIGMYALSSDLGRLYRMDSELQEMADAAALAAANQLDGRNDSIDRARAAALAIANDSRFADTAATIVGTNIFFATAWANLDGGPFLGTDPADQSSAAWVQVLTERGGARPLLAGIFGIADDFEAQRRATAGTGYIACDVTPLRLCSSDPRFFDDEDLIGRQFELKGSGGTGVVGDFGIVDPPNATNGNQTLEFLAADRANFCFTQGVTVSPGAQVAQTRGGLNTRFAIYPQSNQGLDEIASPAPNVAKGFDSNSTSCRRQTYEQNLNPDGRMPRDTFDADGIGNRDWKDRIGPYLAFQHGDKTEARRATLEASPTRYQLYLRELGITEDAVDTPILHSTLNTTAREYLPIEARPPSQCAKEQYVPSRRIIYVAIVSCDGNTGNATPPRRTNRYAKFFLTEPVTPSSEGSVTYAEFIGLVRVDDGSGILNSIVQLYPNPQD